MPVANGGVEYEGQDGAITYSRSSDGGETWEIQHEILPCMGADDFPGFSALILYDWHPLGRCVGILSSVAAPMVL